MGYLAFNLYYQNIKYISKIPFYFASNNLITSFCYNFYFKLKYFYKEKDIFTSNSAHFLWLPA